MEINIRTYGVSIQRLKEEADIFILKQNPLEYYVEKNRRSQAGRVLTKAQVEQLINNEKNIVVVGDKKAKLYNFNNIELTW